MSQPISIPDPARPDAAHRARGAAARGALVASAAVAGGTAVLGVAGGFAWAALAPRALLIMTGPRAAAVADAETSAFIVADAMFCLVCLAGGVISGLAGYLLAVRRWGPLPMAGVLLGALAAAFVARWVGQQDGLATFHHLLATLPAGARLRGTLTLGADPALALWPLAAGLVAGSLTALATREPDDDPATPRHRTSSPH
jgi:hypothetical protein